MTRETFEQIATGLREAIMPIKAFRRYEKPEELIERALEGDARALRVLIFITHNAGYAAAVDDMGPTDEQILEAFNRGRVEDSEIDRENAVEISGGDISQLDIEME